MYVLVRRDGKKDVRARDGFLAFDSCCTETCYS